MTGEMTPDATKLLEEHGGAVATELASTKRPRENIIHTKSHLAKRRKETLPSEAGGPSGSTTPQVSTSKSKGSKSSPSTSSEPRTPTTKDRNSESPNSDSLIPTISVLKKNCPQSTTLGEIEVQLSSSEPRFENDSEACNNSQTLQPTEPDQPSEDGSKAVGQQEATELEDGPGQLDESTNDIPPEESNPPGGVARDSLALPSINTDSPSTEQLLNEVDRIEARSPGSAAASRSTKPSTTPTKAVIYDSSTLVNWIWPNLDNSLSDATDRYQNCAIEKMRAKRRNQRRVWEAKPAELADLASMLTGSKDEAIKMIEGSPRIIARSHEQTPDGTTDAEFRPQIARNLDMISQIEYGSRAWTEIRTIRELEQVEREVEENSLRALMFPMCQAANNYYGDRPKEAFTAEIERETTRKTLMSQQMMTAVASQARPFYLSSELFRELHKIRQERILAEDATAAIDPKQRPPCEIDVNPTTKTERWMTTEDAPGALRSVGQFIRCQDSPSGGYEIFLDGKFFPKSLITFKGMEISTRPVNSSQEHHNYAAPKTRKGFTTHADVEERQLAEPGNSHLVFISPHDLDWEISHEAKFKIQQRQKNYKSRFQQCEVAHLQREIRLGDRILAELNEFRGELAHTSFYQGTLDEWRSVIEQATPVGPGLTYVASTHSHISAPTKGIHGFYRGNTYAVRISPFNRVDILTTESSEVTLSPMLLGGFDKICWEKEREHMEAILGPVQPQMVTADQSGWLGSVVRSNSDLRRPHTEVTIETALQVDEGQWRKSVMSPLVPEQINGWVQRPSCPGNESNLIRLQLEILQRTVSNLSVSLHSDAPQCMETLRLLSRQTIKAAATTLKRLDRMEEEEYVQGPSKEDVPRIWVPARIGPIDRDATEEGSSKISD